MDNGHQQRYLEGGTSALFHESRAALMLTMEPAYFVAWRKRMKLTQDKLAERMGGISVYTVRRWEAGNRKLPPYIGLIMAAIENDLEPIGTEAMIEVDGGSED